MRKLVVTNLITLDGYVTGPEGNVMLLPMDASFSGYNVERLRAADTLLLGGTTYRGLVSYWPGVADDPSQPDVEREISSRDNAIEKVVVSDSLTEEETGAWRETTEIVRRADAHRRVAELKDRDGGDILMFASTVLWNDLLVAGLVDELHLMIGAGAVGSGVPAFRQPFGGYSFPGALSVMDVRKLDGSDNILVQYAVSAG